MRLKALNACGDGVAFTAAQPPPTRLGSLDVDALVGCVPHALEIQRVYDAPGLSTGESLLVLKGFLQRALRGVRGGRGTAYTRYIRMFGVTLPAELRADWAAVPGGRGGGGGGLEGGQASDEPPGDAEQPEQPASAAPTSC